MSLWWRPIDKILFAFVSISIPIYIIFLLTIILNRKKEPFNSHFFLLSISLGVADLAAVIHCYLFIRIPGFGWFWSWYVDNGPDGSFLAYYALALQFSLSCSQHLSVMLIGLNRFSRLALRDNVYNKLWSKNIFMCAIFLQWFLPAIVCASMAPQKFYYWASHDTNSSESAANIDFSDETAETVYYAIAICINFVANILTFTSYAVIFTISFKQAIKRTKTVSDNQPDTGSVHRRDSNRKTKLNYVRELKLAFSGFALFVAMLAYFVFLVLIAITGNFDWGFLWYTASDVFSCINPYTVLIMSKETRKQFLNLIQFWK